MQLRSNYFAARANRSATVASIANFKEQEEEERRFELLRRAYVDARYKMDEYTITKEELEYLAEKVNRLKNLTETLCKAKIEQIGVR